MTERPILFSGPMVRAILAGRKTQTRRVITSLAGFGRVTEFGQSETRGYDWCFRDRRMLWNEIRNDSQCISRYCPHGKPGDRLWVRETWAPMQKHRPIANPEIYDNKPAWYAADNDRPTWAGSKWKTSIFMPRAASRLTLEITDVRVERLQEIDEEDAIAEGVQVDELGHAVRDDDEFNWGSATGVFANRWDRINGKRAPWDSNPWVWVITFRRVDG